MTAGIVLAAQIIVGLVLGCLGLLAGAAVTGALVRGGRRTSSSGTEPTIASSRFTIPVSVVVPVENAAALPAGWLETVLAQAYPDFELILVTDAAPGAEIPALERAWAMQPKEVFYRRMLPAAPVRRISVSRRDTRLMLVEKEYGGRADAMNCGVNLARFRYVVVLPVGLQVASDALSRLMAPALQNAGTVLAVAAHAEPDGDWSRLAGLRNWLASRLWPERLVGLLPRPAVVAWRRDALLEAGGFPGSVADPAAALAVRLGAVASRGLVLRTSTIVGRLVHGDATRHPAAGSLFQFRHLPPVVAMERLLAVLPLIAVGLLVLLAAGGAVSWLAPATALVFVAFGTAAVSAAALLVRGAVPGAPCGRELRRLLLQAPVEGFKTLTIQN